MAEKIEGKKVFFVYPHSVFQENLIQKLVDQEFEIYTIDDHNFIPKIIKMEPDAVFFINIDRELTRDEWESFIRNLLASNTDNILRLGIISYEFDKDLAELYLMELSLPGGYIQVKQKLDVATNIITKTLIANEVKSRRKFVRYQAGENSTLKLNAKIGGDIQNGKGVDISSAGIAVLFDDSDIDIPKNSLLSDLQLNLSGKRVKVSGVVLGFRDDKNIGGRVFVVVFDKTVGIEVRGAIRNYVHRQLQMQMMKTLA